MASGTVEFHAKQYHPTFTRLAATARRNDTLIFLQDAINWEVGQKILLTTTSFYDCPKQYADWCAPCTDADLLKNRPSCNAPDYYPHQNEIREIVAISVDTSSNLFVIQFDKPLNYDHYAGPEYQGEVALLSRRFRFSGEDSGDDNFGGHVMVYSSTGIGRFSGIQGENMGQLNTMGRYPFHLHLIGEDGFKSYIQECLVTNSNFRAYTIHGVNNTRLSRSTAFNIKGFAVYLEDGVEEKNLFEYNLISHVHPIYRPANGGGSQDGDVEVQRPELLMPGDISASGFYITNAYNDFIGNVASGGWSGFAFPGVFKPLGLHKHLDFGNNNPANRPTKNFSGNTAHSTGFYWKAHGAGLYVGGNIFYDPKTGDMKYSSGRYTRETIFANGTDDRLKYYDTKSFSVNKGITHWGLRNEFYRTEVHDFGANGVTLFSQCALVDCLINAKTPNKEGWFYQRIMFQGKLFSGMGFQFYDTKVQTLISRTTLRNFNDGNFAVGFNDNSDEFTPQGITAVKGLRFENTPKKNILAIQNCGEECPEAKKESMAARIHAVWDFDGSLALTPGRSNIIGSNRIWWNVESECYKEVDWKQWICPWRTSDDISYLPLGVPGLTDGCDTNVTPDCTDQNAPYTVGYVTQFGKSKEQGIPIAPWPGVAGHSSVGWYWRSQLNYGTISVEGAPSKFYIGDGIQVRKKNFVVIAVAYPPKTTFKVKITSKWLTLLETPLIPMATSKDVVFTPTEDLKDHTLYTCPTKGNYVCSNTGGAGLGAWFFDGSHFYLRVVSPGCYTKNQKLWCQTNAYTVDGINVPGINTGFFFEVEADCVGCAYKLYNNIKYYEVPDIVPQVYKKPLGSLQNVELPLTQTRRNSCFSTKSVNYLRKGPESQEFKPDPLEQKSTKACLAEDSSKNCIHPKDHCQRIENQDVCFARSDGGVLLRKPCRLC